MLLKVIKCWGEELKQRVDITEGRKRATERAISL
jgi:hypothetical protein